MGEMADYYRDLGKEFEEEFIDTKINKMKKSWPSKTGRIKIADMDQNYLSNCIRLIKENPGWRDSYLEDLELALAKKLSRWTTNKCPFKRKI